MSLYAELSKISENIRKHRDAMNNSEATTEQVSVLPFLGALGYDTFNPAEVRKQYPILNIDAVDFAILRDDVPVIFVEAKSASNRLQTKEWKQLFQYFNAEIGLRFGILTNGVGYRFYTDLKADNIMDNEPFMTIDMLKLDELMVAELQGFTTTSFDPEYVVASARKRVLARLLREEIYNPSDEIARHFAKQLTSKRLTSDQLSYYAGLVRDAWRELVEPPDAVPPPPQPADRIPVFADYQGRRFKATLMIDDRMWLQRQDNMLFDGKLMNHTVAAFEAVKKVDPSIKKWPTGWIFWHFIDSDTGDERPIKDIFEEVWTRNSSNGY